MLTAQDSPHRSMQRTNEVLSQSFRHQSYPRGNASSLLALSCYLKGSCFGINGKMISITLKAAGGLTDKPGWGVERGSMLASTALPTTQPRHDYGTGFLNPHSTFTCLGNMKTLITFQFLICSTHSYWGSGACRPLGWGLRVIPQSPGVEIGADSANTCWPVCTVTHIYINKGWSHHVPTSCCGHT